MNQAKLNTFDRNSENYYPKNVHLKVWYYKASSRSVQLENNEHMYALIKICD